MPSSQELQRRRELATPRGVGVLAPFFVAKADNAELWDVDGRRYIDFAGGIAVMNTGHRHPRIVQAIEAQLQAFTHTCYQIAPYEGYVTLAERLNQLTPGSHTKKTAFFSTGAEAVENAIKIARAATGRPGVIAFSGGFHGRTLLGMALTGKVAPYKQGFGPFPADIYHLPFPVALHDVSIEASLRALQQLFKADVEPQRVAAIILEPVQGEGGFYIAPPDFMCELRRLCNQYGILLIADEIQTGFGRTGRWYAMEHYNVLPDLITQAKSLAGGLPLSAVTGRAEIMDAPAPGGLGGTYGGSPLAIAAAHAVLDVIEQEGLNRRAELLGQQLKDRLSSLQQRLPGLAEVRGLGAMVAAEFWRNGEPDADGTRRIQQTAMATGLLLLSCGVYSNVLRFLFPLTISDAIFAEALDILESAIVAEIG